MSNGTYDQRLQDALRSHEDNLHEFLMRYYYFLYPILNLNILRNYRKNNQTRPTNTD